VSGRRPIEVTTLGDMVVRAAARRPDEVAVAFPDARVTAAELLEGARRMARGLRALGVRRGDKVGIVMPNCLEYLEAMFGSALLGAVVVTVNARYRASELAYVAGDAGMTVLLTSDVLQEQVDFVRLLDEALPGLADAPDPRALALAGAPELRACVMFGSSSPPGFLDEAEFTALAEGVPGAEADAEAERVRVRDVAIMMYTSGTTAQPKGCPLTHEAIVRTGNALNERFSLTADDVWWDPLPMFHLSSILPLTAALLAGSRFVTMVDFEVEAAIRQIVEERVTYMFGTFPTLNQELLGHPGFLAADLGSVRFINQVAPPDMQRALQRALPHAAQVSAYGCTELGGMISQNDPSETPEQRATTCGTPFPGIEVRIVDPDGGADLPTGALGEIVARGWGMFEGYHNDPERNAEAVESGGWFHTGDIGSLDEDGRIAFHGRTKDMLKVGGENVAALEVESYLSLHPAVKLVQVVGIPDARLVEVPAAFVELAQGATATEEELIAFCRGQIASFKIPRHVRFVGEWPMSATKIQKFKLRERLLDELGIDP
jgi:acyl-CoA synthetase (AMP-forming)/AMP-acid ligase II